MPKLRLYLSTASHLRPSQLAYRIWRRAGGKTSLRRGYIPSPNLENVGIHSISTLPQLDFDPAFLSRFDVEALLDDRIVLLHHEEHVDWCDSWSETYSTPLWRFNLHYHEYLLPLAKAYMDSGDARYLDKLKTIVCKWIDACPRGANNVAWDPYVISMRVVNWLAFLGELSDVLAKDSLFVKRVHESLVEQYIYLSQHLEKDLLANHYLENLKALTVLAGYFRDAETLEIVMPLLQSQVNEQVLSDGMHFELSPMYHKIVLEDLIRVRAMLEGLQEKKWLSVEFPLKKMCDVLYSLERGTERTPLFNDSGDNVAKSRDGLLLCAKERFGIEPTFVPILPDAGYCVLERDTQAGRVKIIFDAGLPGPTYAMGHAHCDCLSFECFVDGKAWIVNRGTYAYQDERRLVYKNTASHNTIQYKGVEQHECWAPFRVARYSTSRLISFSLKDSFVVGEMETPDGMKIRRSISIEEDRISIIDVSDGASDTVSYLGFVSNVPNLEEDGRIKEWYSPEFGESRCIEVLFFERNAVDIPLLSRGGQDD